MIYLRCPGLSEPGHSFLKWEISDLGRVLLVPPSEDEMINDEKDWKLSGAESAVYRRGRHPESAVRSCRRTGDGVME